MAKKKPRLLHWRLASRTPHQKVWVAGEYRVIWRDEVEDVHVDPGFRASKLLLRAGDKCWDRLDYRDKLYRTKDAAIKDCEADWLKQQTRAPVEPAKPKKVRAENRLKAEQKPVEPPAVAPIELEYIKDNELEGL